MALIKRLTEEELAIVEILRHPLFCGEFLHDLVTSPSDEPWIYSSYQREFLCDASNYVSIRAGRAVGKTVSLIDKLAWYSLNSFWNEAIVYTVPNRVHLEPVFLRLTRWFRRHPLLRYYTGRQGINSQSFTIKLYNDVVIDCRIAGQSGTGANVVGLHVPVIILDEAGLYPFGTYTELIPCLNTFQSGFQLMVSGVPTGVREKNVLFFVDQKDTKFSKHRVSAHRNPRYTKEDEERNIKQFGGVENEDYIHLVLGQHGLPSYVMFDREQMLIKPYDMFKGTVRGQTVKDDPMYLGRFYSSLPKMPEKVVEVMLGIDLGYTDPTIISVLYKTTNSSPWKFLARVRLHHIDYPLQEVIIDYFDSLYHPNVLGIDEGSSGKAVIQHLFSDEKFKHKKYAKRLIPIQFRSKVPVGIDEEGKPVEVRAKAFGMQLLQSKVNNHDICFSSKDEEVISELERVTYTKTQSGELVFKVLTPRGGRRHGQDHNTASLLCFVLADYLANEANLLFLKGRVKLYSPKWF